MMHCRNRLYDGYNYYDCSFDCFVDWLNDHLSFIIYHLKWQ